jgi:hypothetical protein
MKKIALFMAAIGFLAFSGLARAEGEAPAPAAGEKKAPKKTTKKDAPAGDTAAPAPKTEKKAETK